MDLFWSARRHLLLASLVCAAAVSAGPVWAADAGVADGDARVIVKLKAGSALLQVSEARQSKALNADAAGAPMRRMGQRLGMNLQDGRRLGERTHVAMASGMGSAALARKLSAQSDVEYAVVDQRRSSNALTSITPSDPLYPASGANAFVANGQWYLRAPTVTAPASIDAPAAWAITTGLSSVTVAVLDTGVRFEHPELTSKLLSGYNMVGDAVRASNQVGRNADATDFGDWLLQAEIDANPTIYTGCTAEPTSSWHGTQVAGIIGAASDNATGMASLAWGSSLLPVRVLAKCGGYDSDIIAGMRWAAGLGSETVKPSQNARVLNLSLGGEGSCSKAYQDVLAELSALKVVVVASAGNTVGKAVSVPANCPGVIAVAGIRHVGTKVGYSALGPEVTLSAPSGNCGGNGGACSYPILTTLNSGTTTADATSNGQTYSGSGSTDASYGTSFSAPQVSGTVALMLSVRPELTTAAVKQILKNTARAFPTAGGSANIAQCQAPTSTEQDECYCTTTTCGAGMLDAGMAVAAASLPVALVTVNPSSPVSGQSMSLSGATSLPGVGGTAIVSYSWTLVDGGGIVSALLAGNDPAVVSATPGAAGSFTVQLTVNDGVNPASSSLHTVTVTVPSVTTTQAQSGGGGGGALSELTLAALLGFVLLARRFQVRRKRAIAR